MPELIFKKLGINPEQEAELIHTLCSSDGIDDAILSEFSGTVSAYVQPPDESAVARIANRYRGINPLAVGSIVLLDRTVIGLAYSGIADFQMESDARPTTGINVSSWLLSHCRGKGIGSHMISHATQEAINQSHDPHSNDWRDKKIWTSIKIGNIASKRACEKVGFIHTGTLFDDPNRDLYLLRDS